MSGVSNLNEAKSAQLRALLSHVSDDSALGPFEKKFGSDIHHAKAILKSVYEDKRRTEQDEFAEFVYRETYDQARLEQRPFINFGPGNFRHKYWQTADKIYAANGGKLWSESRGKSFREEIDFQWDMYERKPIAIDDGTFEIAYASHIVEHAYNADNAFFFKDVHRILRKGGVFRLTAPNIDLGLRSARNKDYSYYGYPQFLRGGVKRDRVFGPPEKRLPIEWFVVENCSLLVRDRNSTFLTPEQCVEFLWSDSDVYKTLDKASDLSDRSLNEKLAAHVNWFNPEKICSMLKVAGFEEVKISSYAQSVNPVLRDTRYFDNTSPQVSWYVDAIK